MLWWKCLWKAKPVTSGYFDLSEVVLYGSQWMEEDLEVGVSAHTFTAQLVRLPASSHSLRI